MSQSVHDAYLIRDALATRFLLVKRRELRMYTGLDNVRLHRAILQCERQGILIAEHNGKLALAERLYELRNEHVLSRQKAAGKKVGCKAHGSLESTETPYGLGAAGARSRCKAHGSLESTETEAACEGLTEADSCKAHGSLESTETAYQSSNVSGEAGCKAHGSLESTETQPVGDRYLPSQGCKAHGSLESTS